MHSLIVGLVLFSVLSFFTALVSVPLCPIKRFFGVPCPGCGMTRGFLAVLRLDFAAALRFHVLSIPLFWGTLVYAILCVTDILLDRRDLERVERTLSKPYLLPLWIFVFLLSVFLNQYF